jgi:hypothetical protein
MEDRARLQINEELQIEAPLGMDFGREGQVFKWEQCLLKKSVV